METDDKNTKWTIFGSVGAAVGAAVCCLGPVVLVSLGVSGAWIGSLSALEPYRPLFMVVAAGFLGFGYYRVYGASNQEECGEGEECEVPRANLANRVSLWVATVAVAALFASPYLLTLGLDDASAAGTDSTPAATSAVAAGASKTNLATATLEVDGMTCGGCARTIQSTLEGIEGVEDARVSYEASRARVDYDPSKVSVEKLTTATTEVGYPSKLDQ